MKSSEFCPKDYTIYRKDLLSSGRGVIIATKSTYKCDEVPEIDTNCELIWIKLQSPRNKTIYVGAYHRWHVSDESSIHEADASLAKLRGDTNSTTIIGGDMNFPGWDWKINRLIQEHHIQCFIKHSTT